MKKIKKFCGSKKLSNAEKEKKNQFGFDLTVI